MTRHFRLIVVEYPKLTFAKVAASDEMDRAELDHGVPLNVIATTGPYRWTRNPMYLGMALIYAGLAIGVDGPIAFALLPLVLIAIQTQVIAREERYLEAKFGGDYRRYKAEVRRWL